MRAGVSEGYANVAFAGLIMGLILFLMGTSVFQNRNGVVYIDPAPVGSAL